MLLSGLRAFTVTSNASPALAVVGTINSNGGDVASPVVDHCASTKGVRTKSVV